MSRIVLGYLSLDRSFLPTSMPFASHIPYHVPGRSSVGPLAITLKTFECLSPSEIMQGAK